MKVPTFGDLIARLRREHFELSSTGTIAPAELARLAHHFRGLVADLDLEPMIAELAKNVASLNSIAYRMGWNARGESLAREIEQARTEAGLRELAELGAEHEGAGL